MKGAVLVKLFIKIRYDGTAYCGYQVQKGRPTIQGELNDAARKLFGAECNVTGCSRTDAGVHALCFCAVVEFRDPDNSGKPVTDIPPEKIPLAFNAMLPEDISVFYASWMPDGFHPRYDVKSKTYRYRILNSPYRSPFEEKKAYHFPKVWSDDDIKRMNEAAGYFCGTHDFSAFMATGSKITDAVRTVRTAEVKKEDDIVTFTVSADGFLYNMVRIMAGTLIEVGCGKLRPEDIPVIIESRDRHKAGSTLAPYGLYLTDVNYDS